MQAGTVELKPDHTTIGLPVRRRRFVRAALVAATVLVIFLGYELLTSLVAYTDDAYVRSDLVAIAPQVTGTIASVDVHDNQTVHRGDLLFTIDPVPFQLIVDERQAALREANAQAAADRAGVDAARDNIAAAVAALQLAKETQQRISALTTDSFASRQQLDNSTETLHEAQAKLDNAKATLDKEQQATAEGEAAIARAQADLASAVWRLQQTKVVAPVDGNINNLTLRVGDMARTDAAAIGIIDAAAWRIMANYKQYYLRGFRPDSTVWIWLDSHPWHFYRAHIQGIARGISRDPDRPDLLPYVAPTTDWIRLQRRFPVTLLLDEPPPDGTLFMGADARTIIFP